ncbi:MAG TPA: hypothetical protein VHC72_02970, partial [Bryobacteraceae bacterium]|nr:hypothetical protein [Bryobacteraceae bacterium]
MRPADVPPEPVRAAEEPPDPVRAADEPPAFSSVEAPSDGFVSESPESETEPAPSIDMITPGAPGRIVISIVILISFHRICRLASNCRKRLS